MIHPLNVKEREMDGEREREGGGALGQLGERSSRRFPLGRVETTDKHTHTLASQLISYKFCVSEPETHYSEWILN